VKIVGNIFLVITETGASSNIEIAVWGSILSQLGFYPLLGASQSFIHKWYFSIKYGINNRIGTWGPYNPSLRGPLKPLQLLRVVVLVAFILGIISGVWSSPGNANINTGYELRRAADILFLIGVLIIFAIALFLFSRASSREQRYDLVLIQVIIVCPILIVRIIYATVQAFLSTPSNPGRNTWVYLGLLLCEDFIAVTIYTVCGYIIPPKRSAATYGTEGYANPKEIGMTPPQTQKPFEQAAPATYPQQTTNRGRRQRRVRRPIHMLIDAIRGNE
jgi:hypothetical protein